MFRMKLVLNCFLLTLLNNSSTFCFKAFLNLKGAPDSLKFSRTVNTKVGVHFLIKQRSRFFPHEVLTQSLIYKWKNEITHLGHLLMSKNLKKSLCRLIHLNFIMSGDNFNKMSRFYLKS